MARVAPGVKALRQQQLAGMQQVTAGNPALQARKPVPQPPARRTVAQNVSASRNYLAGGSNQPTLGQAAGGRPQPVRGGGGRPGGGQRPVPRPPAGRGPVRGQGGGRVPTMGQIGGNMAGRMGAGGVYNPTTANLG